MTSIQLILSDTKTDFKTILKPSIKLDKPSEIALINLETYYSIPNITGKNHLIIVGIKAKPHDRAYYIYLPTGSYNLPDINDVIQKELKKLYVEDPVNHNFFTDENDEENVIMLKPDLNQLKTIMIIKKGYFVDFKPHKIGGKPVGQINGILGFNSKLYNEGIHYSEHIVNILPVNSILVNLDIVSGSYVKGSMGNTLYSFFPSVSPGHKIIERPPYPIYLPLIMNEINRVHVTLTDQNGELINLRGENLTIRFHIRDIKPF